MILIGIDDTDTRESRGTNQLARELVTRLDGEYRCLRITRHQLLHDPRIPFTSKNGSASIVLVPRSLPRLEALLAKLASWMRELYIPGSDPGLCVAMDVPASIVQFGKRCQTEVVCQSDARRLAQENALSLLGLGGTEDGVIGALAAVGLAAGDNDGRVVHVGSWTEDVSGVVPVAELNARGVAVEELGTGRPVEGGRISVGKKLRPNWRRGGCVLFVRRVEEAAESSAAYCAVKLT